MEVLLDGRSRRSLDVRMILRWKEEENTDPIPVPLWKNVAKGKLAGVIGQVEFKIGSTSHSDLTWNCNQSHSLSLSQSNQCSLADKHQDKIK